MLVPIFLLAAMVACVAAGLGQRSGRMAPSTIDRAIVFGCACLLCALVALWARP